MTYQFWSRDSENEANEKYIQNSYEEISKLGRPKLRLAADIIVDLIESDVGWNQLARMGPTAGFLNTVMNARIP
jgi:hypothetical protein